MHAGMSQAEPGSAEQQSWKPVVEHMMTWCVLEKDTPASTKVCNLGVKVNGNAGSPLSYE